MKTIIKNGTVVSPGETYAADILIDGETIVSIGTDLEAEGARIIDAAGKYVIPGGVDVHTHMDLQAGACRAVDDFYHGTVAAACGGTTTIVDHMAFGPAGCALHYQLNEYHHLAEGKAVTDYGFHGTAQHVDDTILDELESMVQDGVPSVKVYLTYDFRLDDAAALKILKRMKELGGVTAFHCENHAVVEDYRRMYRDRGDTSPIYHAKSRPNLAEAEAVARVLYLARLAGDAPVYIVHLSCKESLDAVADARRRGQKNIYVETCPQYLTLTEERYLDEDGLKYIMSPPLRTQEDCDRLWEGLASGEIQVVATDHCPFHYHGEKQLGRDDFTKCPNGAPGVEERMMLLFSEGVMKKRISINQFVEAACTNPAKIYGMYPQKGILQPGSDGDLVVIDPSAESEFTQERMHGASDYTAYEGMKLQGSLDLVMQRGNILAEHGVFQGKKGAGLFLKRKVNQNF
ncbi:MAG: dihydropyrimidinase [Lachnospiraceae bacterium]|nr:dihydropyrimidinase [Lachnospiraceae bacterium]